MMSTIIVENNSNRLTIKKNSANASPLITSTNSTIAIIEQKAAANKHGDNLKTIFFNNIE